jgi:hypothetical protein
VLSADLELDQVIADGLGINLAAVRKLSAQVGVVAALSRSTVPVAQPVLDAAALRGALDQELQNVIAVAAPSKILQAGRRKARAAAPARDALDDLIDRAAATGADDESEYGTYSAPRWPSMSPCPRSRARGSDRRSRSRRWRACRAGRTPSLSRGFVCRMACRSAIWSPIPICCRSNRSVLLSRSRVDRRAVQGALSVGMITTADRAQLEAVYPRIARKGEAERTIRTPQGEERLKGQAGDYGLPDALRAPSPDGRTPCARLFTDDRGRRPDDGRRIRSDRMKVLRMERLAPAVLLVLFDGVPAVVHVEEPRQGIQFGVRLDPADPPAQRKAKVKVRDNLTGDPVPPKTAFTDANSVDVPFRKNAPGVINVTELRKRLAAKSPKSGGSLEPNEYALQMLRFPYRQVSAIRQPRRPAVLRCRQVRRASRCRREGDRGKQSHQGAAMKRSHLDRSRHHPRGRTSKRFLAADRADISLADITTLGSLPAAPTIASSCQSTQAVASSLKPRRWCASRCSSRVRTEKWSRSRKTASLIHRGRRDAAGGRALHWAMPDALLRGALNERADGASNRLSLPLLPDRWVVLRLLLPKGGDRGQRHGLSSKRIARWRFRCRRGPKAVRPFEAGNTAGRGTGGDELRGRLADQ